MPSVLNNVSRMDPTRTLSLRNRFAREMRARWDHVIRDVRKSILEQDCFGILGVPAIQSLAATSRQQFAFETAERQLELFMEWLRELEDAEILSFRTRAASGFLPSPLSRRIATDQRERWTDPYIRESYLRGVSDARSKLELAGYTAAEIGTLPGAGAGVEILSNPIHADRIGLLYSRTFEDLKTVMEAANAEVRRAIADGLRQTLSEGIAEGLNPREIARRMVADAESALASIGKTRAELIARTEIIRAHHVANIAEYRRVDATLQVTVLAEVLNGPAPCPICVELAANGPYTLSYAEGLIPAHPRCVCGVAPHVVRADSEEAQRASIAA